MPTTINTDLDTIQAEPAMLAQIAGVLTMKSCGIIGVASKGVADRIFQLLRSENPSKRIEVDADEASINVKLHVILEYDVRISTVGENTVDRVRLNIEQMIGLTVDDIEILVEGIRTD